MSPKRVLSFRNCKLVRFGDIPNLKFDDFADTVIKSIQHGNRLIALFAQPEESKFRLFAVTSSRAEGALRICSTQIKDTYPSISAECSQAHWFEREIAETWGVTPIGHP